ncbi:hypothetical protein [Mycolicibacterium helvum]|uniref:Helix-turn-helix domain-containing protein n=1 Tax=Mycolicibacterium helvum TaxID=1534349 RepID=A0A7I7TEM4_9MYCO|nr:hypothetical protein [Mycolicibacterium helvum]BBY67558.1 hypothetical protein MHEL_58010 [Mycolicibacterium helvum]
MSDNKIDGARRSADGTVEPPKFLKVRPADIGRVGVLGAAILALVRYVIAFPDETDGRKIVDGEMWWCASHDDIGRALGGVHRDSIRRALAKLQSADEILTIPADRRYGDRAHAYRAPDLPLRGMQQGSELPLRGMQQGITRNAASSCGETQQAADAKHNNLPLTKELEEEGRSAAPPSLQSANGKPTYSPRCPKHIHDENPPACGGCGRAREASKASAQTAQEREAQRRNQIRDAIDACGDCDQVGRLDDLSDCPKHPNFRMIAVSA